MAEFSFFGHALIVERASLAVVLRIIRTGPEPDIAADLRVDDGIAGHDLAIVGGPIADHPMAPVGKTRPPCSRRSSAPASSNDFMVSRSCSESRPSKPAFARKVPPAMNCRRSWLTAKDQISRPSTFSVSDLTRSGTFSQMRVHRQGFAERVQRALLVTDLLHDHAEPGERAEMAGFTDQDLLDVLERAGVVVPEIIESSRACSIPRCNRGAA